MAIQVYDSDENYCDAVVFLFFFFFSNSVIKLYTILLKMGIMLSFQ